MNHCLIALVIFLPCVVICAENELLVVTVATEQTDGYLRYERAVKMFKLDYKIFGMGEKWNGGDVKLTTGGGQKVNILVKELEKYKDDKNKVILFTDSYDVIITESAETILEKFKSLDANVVFGAEGFCWPDKSLEDDYPKVKENQKRFLNSGGFIGFAPDIYELITSSKIKDDDDDQLFYTKIFLNKELREKHKIKLDINSEIFQNLNGATEEVSVISVDEEQVNIYNNLTKTVPAIIHGNGAAKTVLNRFGNYIGKAYSASTGCIVCRENTFKLDSEKKEEWPEVTLGIFIEHPTPFLKEFFKKISELNYPKNKLSVLIHNSVDYHSQEVEKFYNDPTNDYASIKYISPDDDSPEHEARTEAIQECKRTNCKYYFSIDSTAHVDNNDTLKLLIEQNRTILSPIMTRPDSTWSNVWGAINEKGYYLRSDDYLNMIKRERLNIWNVPYISEIVLINGSLIAKDLISYEDTFLDAEMAMPHNLRESGVFIYATNMDYYGHLINSDTFNTSLIRPEMYEILSNLNDWADRYIHPDFYDYVTGKKETLQPCPDVYWFPIVTEEFCDNLVAMMEDFGQWSGGKNNNYDPRLPGGYENVPTVDIHMKQVNWEKHWLYFLKKFVQLMQRKIYTGYYHDPPTALLSFVVKYRPGEQDHLTPHHDASTYTTNLALNVPNVDFVGGGVRFVRYNCSVLDTKKGWVMMHPGRLTHYHEGLKVTNGTRYIMVTFIDP